MLRYVDVILELTEKAGEFVSDDIWYRVVHIVTNHEELQVLPAYAGASGASRLIASHLLHLPVVCAPLHSRIQPAVLPPRYALHECEKLQ